MTIFDLLFLALCLASVVTLLVAGAFAIFGPRRRALRIVTTWAIAAAIYLLTVAVVSLVVGRRTLAIGEPLCFDDWCVTVDGVDSTAASPRVEYTVNLTVSSRARRIRQRENNVVVYLTDGRGARFDALPAATDVPFNVQLGPGESAHVSRTFNAPADAQQLGVVIAHEGGFPITWFILGEGPFRKPPVVWLPAAGSKP
jgi:hypothetical protein